MVGKSFPAFPADAQPASVRLLTKVSRNIPIYDQESLKEYASILPAVKAATRGAFNKNLH